MYAICMYIYHFISPTYSPYLKTMKKLIDSEKDFNSFQVFIEILIIRVIRLNLWQNIIEICIAF